MMLMLGIAAIVGETLGVAGLTIGRVRKICDFTARHVRNSCLHYTNLFMFWQFCVDALARMNQGRIIRWI